MTDQLFDLTQQGGVGRQPITNVGRVAYNLRFHQNEIERRKRRGAANSPWPTANMEDRTFWVLPRDICLSMKQYSTRKKTDGMMEVFSVLNGIQLDGVNSRRELIESLTFGGIAGGQGAKFDTRGNEPRHPEFVGIFGGLYTIVNNGSERITNGQQVYWDIPEFGIDAGAAVELSRRDTHRITAVTRPFIPSKNKVSAEALRESINNSHKQAYKQESNVDQAAIRFKNVALQMTVNAMEALLASGLVRVDEEAVDDAARREVNAREWSRTRNKEDILTRVGTGLGCRHMKGEADELYKIPGTDKSVKEYICNLLTFEERLVDFENGNSIPGGRKGELMRNQEAVLKDLLAGVEQANRYVTDRIFCTALTPAAKGKEFVGIFGHYRQ